MKFSKKELLYMNISFFIFSLILMGALLTLEKSYLDETLERSNLQMESILPKDYHYRFHLPEGISKVEYRSLLAEVRKYCTIKKVDLFWILEVRDKKLVKSMRLPKSDYEKLNPYTSLYSREVENKRLLDMGMDLVASRKIGSRNEGYILVDGEKYIVNLTYNRDYFGNEYILGVGRSFKGFLLKGIRRTLRTFGVVLGVVALSGAGTLLLMKRVKEKEILSARDELTGFYTRRYLKVIEERVRRSGRSYWGFIYTDLDNLKVVNDRLGHEAGDRYILSFTRFLNTSFRRGEDYLVRMGGDEFLVVTLLKNREELSLLTKRLKGKRSRELMFSLGAAYIKPEETSTFTFNHLLTVADKKMYEDKRGNKGKTFRLCPATLKNT